MSLHVVRNSGSCNLRLRLAAPTLASIFKHTHANLPWGHQRSIRQRTKTHIEELEQRIRDLSQDQDARDFEQIKRRNAELEDELRHLRELLGRSDGSVASSPELTPLSCKYHEHLKLVQGKSRERRISGRYEVPKPISHPSRITSRLKYTKRSI